MPAFLHGFGSFVPERVVANVELAARLGRTPEWIESASGIRERRWADSQMSVATMASAAARDCLERSNADAASIGMLLVSSGSASRGFPGPAAEVAVQLGLGQTPAIDLPIASAGSLFGLALAMNSAERHGDILVVAAEKMSSVIDTDPLDPNTAILFGDGAGAALVSARPGPWKLLDAVLHTDGEYREALKYDGATLTMNGLTVILQAARKIPAVIQEALERQKIAPQDVGVYLIHQANLNLLTRVAKALSVPVEKVFTNVQKYGNTSSASLLIAAAEWSAANPAATEPMVLAAFGAGFHWGSIVAVRA